MNTVDLERSGETKSLFQCDSWLCELGLLTDVVSKPNSKRFQNQSGDRFPGR
jgi:hypothetical protein